jgi:hypothetical protein
MSKTKFAYSYCMFVLAIDILKSDEKQFTIYRNPGTKNPNNYQSRF